MSIISLVLLTIAGVGLFGLVVGSFLNVCIFRIPLGKSIVLPRSRCPNCEKALSAWQNIPLFSYLVLRGRCYHCKSPIGWMYPTVEALTSASLLLLYWKYDLGWAFSVNGIFFCLLIVLVFIDLRERILPDPLTLGGAALGFALAPVQSPEFFPASGALGSYLQSALGGLLGGGILWLVSYLYLLLKKREGMGFGDVKLMLMVGVFVGWQMTWLTIFLGSLAGAILGLLFIFVFAKGRYYELPFGTFLGFAAMAATLWGPQLVRWYLDYL